MMARAQIPDALLAAACTLAVFAPMRGLFRDESWVAPALLTLIVVLLLGIVGRMITARPMFVSIIQAAGASIVLSWLHAPETLAAGLVPTPTTFVRFGELAAEAQQVISNYAAPAPVPPGVAFVISALVAFMALIVDLVAVTRRAPTLAGLPLLTGYLITAANTGDALPWGYFLLAAGLWLLLVARQGVGEMQRWSRIMPSITGRGGRTQDPTRSIIAVAQVTAVVALVAALILPGFLPHLPTRYVADGLARQAGGGGSGDISLSTTVDLAASLNDPSDRVVLRYRTTDRAPGPLRVDVVADVTGRELTSDGVRVGPKGLGERPVEPPQFEEPPAPDTDETRRYSMTVLGSALAAPQVAVPPRVQSGDFRAVPWGLDSTGVVRAARKATAFQVSYLRYDPTVETLAAADTYPADGQARLWAGDRDRYLATDEQSSDRLRAILGTLDTGSGSQIATAAAIQEYFRSSRFRYSLELEPTQRGDDGQPLDPVSNFLETRVGYCQQFAGAMVLMAREAGIPARMAVGFLPGTPQADGTRVVVAADAHAWPELWFDGVGWVRFEPTPGARAASSPEYANNPDRPSTSVGTSGETTSAEPSASSSSAPTAQRPEIDTPTDVTTTTNQVTWRDRLAAVPVIVWLAAVAVLLLIGLGSAPLVARWITHRSRRLARDDAERVEVEWQRLVADLSDIGVTAPVGSSPRQAGASIAEDLDLGQDQRDALGRVVATLESARYARPGASIGSVEQVTRDTDAVLGAARRHQHPRTVWRARLFPAATLRRWREVLGGRGGRHRS